MVPGSTLMYGSSLSAETASPRALRSRPTLAAVMPLPREEVTPPVTKTYFAIARFSSGGFFQFYGGGGDGANRPREYALNGRRLALSAGFGAVRGDRFGRGPTVPGRR